MMLAGKNFGSSDFRVGRMFNYTGFRNMVSFVRVPLPKHSPQRTRRTRRKSVKNIENGKFYRLQRVNVSLRHRSCVPQEPQQTISL